MFFFRLVFFALATAAAVAEDRAVAIAIHGGAGTLERVAMDPDKESQYRRFLEELVSDGHDQLNEGHPGLDVCLLYTSPSPRDRQKARMPSSA